MGETTLQKAQQEVQRFSELNSGNQRHSTPLPFEVSLEEGLRR